MNWVRWVAEALARFFAWLRSQRDIELGERRERDKADDEADRLIARANRARDAVDGLPNDDPDNRDRG